MHIDSDIGVNEYWLDESGDKRILCQGFAGTFTDYQNYCYCELNAADQKWTSKEIEKGNIDAEAELINVDGINYTILSDDTASIVRVDYNTFGSELINDPLVIPETINGHTVTSIEMSAFGATGFTEIELPESITYIGPMAFNNCRYLEKINLPEKLQFMGEYAFQNTSSLSQIEINCPELVIPSFAFLYSGLSEVNLNAAETDAKAFKGCDKLEKVIVGNNVDVIAANAFEDCTAIAEVDMSSASAHIGEGAFYSSVELDSVTIPKEVEIIGALPEAQGLVMFSGFEPIPATDPLTDDPVCVFDTYCVINGWYNTEAHRYALEWGLKFNALDELEYGDANQDGSINISDAVVLQNYLLRGNSVGYEADLNKDGRIDVFDMIKMRNTLVISN